MSIKQPEYSDGDIKITPVTMGDSTLIDVQEVGNPKAWIRFVPSDDCETAVKR